MTAQLLLAKIAANPTETAWSQIYSTLNLAIVLELHEKEEGSNLLGSYGKKLLEKLQREYFALDEKNLSTIKSAVTNSLDEVPEDVLYSIILTTIIEDICYIIIVNSGSVILKRAEKLGIIATGESGVHGYSGNLEHKDVLVLQTESFSQKIPQDILKNALMGVYVTDTAEQLAPLLHNEPQGNEAAIFMQYTNINKNNLPQEIQTETLDENDANENNDLLISHAPAQDLPGQDEEVDASSKGFNFSHILPNIKLSKRIIFTLILIFLITILGISLYSERSSSQKKLSQNRLEQFLPKTLKQVSEAEALMEVNKAFAIRDLKEAKSILEKEQKSFLEDSSERKQIDALLARVNKNLDSLSANASVKNKKEVFKVANEKEFSQIGAITFKSGKLLLADKEKGIIVNISEKETLESDVKNVIGVSADESYIYIVGEEALARIDKKTKKITSGKSQSGTQIDTFNNNIYVLENSDIFKYIEPNSPNASYFKEKPSIDVVTFTIDGSVWIADKGGQIQKFTKGIQDSMPFSGIPDGIGGNLQLYTEAELANIYLLDKENKKLHVIKKNGQYQNQYNLSEFDTPISFAVDEKSSTVFIATKKSVFSFDL